LGPKVYPPEYQNGWKDTLLSEGSDVTTIIVKYGKNPGKFPTHCHIMLHEDNDMMRQFRLVFPRSLCHINGKCEVGEDCISCPEDCKTESGAKCGNLLCESSNGEDCHTCPQDCRKLNGVCCGEHGTCGDGCVDSETESYCTIKWVHSVCCGDLLCDPNSSENSKNCPVDCPAGKI